MTRRSRLLGWVWALLLACLPAIVARADNQVAVPALKAHVNDLTGTLTTQQAQALEMQLASLERDKGAQVVVLMLPSTQPEDIADYATRVFDQWKIGRKNVDDGVLVVIAKNDHRAMIETGYGLEGAIPDATAWRIINEYMAPKFRNNDYYGGLNDALLAIVKLVDGESLPPPMAKKPQGGGLVHGDWFNGLIVAWIALVWARGIFAAVPRVPRAGLVGAAAGGLAWLFSGILPLALVLGVIGLFFGYAGRVGGVFARGGGFGGWGGGFGGGSGGGGFGGGGGFSGGGGMTGGGGASGSW